MKVAITLAVGVFLLLGSAGNAFAQYMSPVDWQNAWSQIPASNHTVKSSITSAIAYCGDSDRNSGLIQVWSTSFAGSDSLVVDAARYFSGLPYRATCGSRICTAAAGCYLDVYGPPSITTRGNQQPDNHGRGNNNADQQDTSLYSYPLIWEDRVFSWSMLSPSSFNSIRNSRLDSSKKIMYRAPLGDRPILQAVMRSSVCVLEEMDLNHDGAADINCQKFFQYIDGEVVDMYSPNPYDDGAENDTRVTYSLFSRSDSTMKIEETAARSVPGLAAHQSEWRPEGNTIKAGQTVAMQMPNFKGQDATAGNAVDYICSQMVSAATAKKTFIPTRTDGEFESFRKATAAGAVKALTIEDCQRRYTSWVGTTTCPTSPCGVTVTIAAERYCQRSSSAYGECNECAGVSDPQPKSAAYLVNKCFFRRTCVTQSCPSSGPHDCVPASGKILMAEGGFKRIADVSVGDSVMAFDRHSPLASLQPAKVIAVTKTENKGLIKVNGFLITPDHLVLTKHGTRLPVHEMTIGSEMVGVSGEIVPVREMEEAAPETVYNLQLDHGDGFVVDGVRVLAEPRKE